MRVKPSGPAARRLLALSQVLLFSSASADDVLFRRHEISAGSSYSACAALDVDRDGRLDVVSGGWWYEAPLWKRHFLRQVEVIRGRYDDYSNLPLDVNGDGWTDLVSANYRSQKLAWIEHPGPGLGAWKEHVVARPGSMETARLVDVDGDGRLDVLPNGVRFAAGWEVAPPGPGGDGPRWIRHELPREVAGHGMGFGDVDGDGRGDVVGPRGWLEAPEDRRRGRWIWHGEFELTRASVPVLVLDVDADGDSDIVWARAHDFGLYWLEQVQTEEPAARGDEQDRPERSSTSPPTSRRGWVRHAIDTSWSQGHSLLLADLDADGRREVVAGKRYLGHDGKDLGEYDPLVIYRYQYDRGQRTWRRGVVSVGGPAGFGLDPKAVDLDGDGDLDLLAPGRSGLYWLENRGRRPDEPEERKAAPAYADHSKLLRYRDAAGAEHPVRTPFDWARRRAHIVAGLELAMGKLPDPSRRVPLDVRVEEEVEAPRYTRKSITFAAEPGDRVPAYLLVPRDLRGKAPAMLCLHQTTRIGKGEPAALGGRRTLHYAHELAERGYVCLAPDYPSFGDYAYDFQRAGTAHASGSMKAVWNNLRAVDLLESLPQVDPERIGCIGHSLGGHNALFTAVFDQRLAAVVSSCGFTAFHDYYGGKLDGWTSDRYMPRIRDVYGSDPDRLPFDFHEVVAALAPRPFFACAPLRDGNFDVGGVRQVMASAARVYALLGAPDALRAVYPDSAHDFPDAVRAEVYRWLDERLQ
ncbi:MAG: FG-GAP-like repeat-containing protein [Planctomycetota bacterium]|nr:FG-GAP-like repeat-containing protein [Planctomycetota bacterium]